MILRYCMSIMLVCVLSATRASYSAVQQKVSAKDSLEIVLQHAVDTARVIILNKLSAIYVEAGLNDRAFILSKEAFSLSKQIHYKRGIAGSLLKIGNIFQARSASDSASRYYLQCLEIAKEMNYRKIIAQCYNNLGIVSETGGNYERAISYYTEAVKIKESLMDRKGVGKTLSNMAFVYRMLKNNKKAVALFRESIQISREFNDSMYTSNSLGSIADLYFEMNKIDSALLLFEQALVIKKATDHQLGIARCMLGIGNIYRRKGRKQDALKYYQEARMVSRACQDFESEALSLNCIGLIFKDARQYDSAIFYIKIYLGKALQLNLKRDVSEAYKNLARIHFAKADYQQAYCYDTLYMSLNDSLYKSESIKRIAEMQVRFESEAKEKALLMLKSKSDLLNIENSNQRLLIIAISTVVFLLISLIYFRAEINKQKNIRLIEKVDAQNRELTTVSLLVSKKNQAFQDVKSKLEQSLRQGGENPVSHIKEVVKDLDSEIQFDEEWATFKYHFEKVHPGFFSKLHSLAPELSNTELRYCAYLRTNLSTKEIANFTNTTVRGVQQSKYRINKKFPAHNEGTLSNYLRKL